MKNLRDYPWKISYTSNTHNTITDFYIPALECAIQYDRKAGFFSSAILSKVARGLGAMLHNKGQIRLIMGCQFSPQDLQAIQQGYELRDALLSRLDADLKPPESFAQLKHLEILSWLIQNQYLDIKIAIPLKENGLPEDSTQQLDPQHIFHEKVGIFTDSKGEKLAFNGSNNESIGGWERNVESFHVYCSWEGGRELDRVEEEVARFEQLWYDVSPNVRVFEVPEAVQKKLLRYAKSTKPDWNAQAEFDSRPLTKELTEPEPEAQPEPELKPDSSAISTVNTPLKDLMFRHTRDTLRQYYKRGLLERDIPTRVVQDNAITLEPQREVPLYVAVSNYVRHFYRLAQIDQRSCLSFLMTLYRKRLTSSFYAIKSSLQRRLDYLLTQRGSVLSDDDLVDVDNEDDAVIAGLESFFEPVDPQGKRI